jgi:hypothetical protein
MSELSEVRSELAEVKALLFRVLEELARRGQESARLLTAVEAGKLLGYRVTQIHAMIASQEIPSIRFGEKGQRRVPLAGLRALIAEKLRDSDVDPELLARMLG